MVVLHQLLLLELDYSVRSDVRTKKKLWLLLRNYNKLAIGLKHAVNLSYASIMLMIDKQHRCHLVTRVDVWPIV